MITAMMKRDLKKLNFFNKQTKYKLAFDILMEYWDYIPDDEKESVNEKLKEIGL